MRCHVFVEHMEMGVTGTEETMDDQRPPRIPPRNTSVIVSVIGKRNLLPVIYTNNIVFTNCNYNNNNTNVCYTGIIEFMI